MCLLLVFTDKCVCDSTDVDTKRSCKFEKLLSPPDIRPDSCWAFYTSLLGIFWDCSSWSCILGMIQQPEKWEFDSEGLEGDTNARAGSKTPSSLTPRLHFARGLQLLNVPNYKGIEVSTSHAKRLQDAYCCMSGRVPYSRTQFKLPGPSSSTPKPETLKPKTSLCRGKKVLKKKTHPKPLNPKS